MNLKQLRKELKSVAWFTFPLYVERAEGHQIGEFDTYVGRQENISNIIDEIQEAVAKEVREKQAHKILSLIDEFGDDPKQALMCITDWLEGNPEDLTYF